MTESTKTKIKILEIKKELILRYKSNNLSPTDIHTLYIEYLKQIIKLGTNSPIYERGNNKYDGCNCYMYALGLTEKRLFATIYREVAGKDFFYNAGFTTFRGPTHLKKQFLEYIKEDFQTLGISSYSSSIEAPLQNNGFKISLFFSDTDFHLARQNIDGTWTEKIGYRPLMRKLTNPYHTNLGDNYQYDRTLEIVKPVIK